MGHLHFLAFSLCILSFPDLSYPLPRWIRDDKMRGSVIKMKTDRNPLIVDPSRVIAVSEVPRVYLYKGFLSDEECDHLIFLAKDKLRKSMVADNKSGKSLESKVRTSSGMFLNKSQDEIVTAIETRIATWTFLPEEHGEAMQILHYELGQKYEPHFDYFQDKKNQIIGGHRIATILMYLSNVAKGGETIFPLAKGRTSQPKDDSWSDCAKEGYAVKPVKGDALLFFSLHPDATPDQRSMHGSCPVVEGEKWSATKWIHVRQFTTSRERFIDNGVCADRNPNCEVLAKLGECKKNPRYMVGVEGVNGYCKKSCNACKAPTNSSKE